MKCVGTQLTLYSFLPKRDINKPDGGEDEYSTHIHTEQHSMNDSVLEINSSANEIIHADLPTVQEFPGQSRDFVLRPGVKYNNVTASGR